MFVVGKLYAEGTRAGPDVMQPTTAQTLAALRLTAQLLGERAALAVDGRFYFELGGPWLLSLTPDDAGRFRVSAWRGHREVASMWCRSEDPDRLADLVWGLRTEVAALVA